MIISNFIKLSLHLVSLLVKYISSHLESWQSGNATDSKSVEPANTGAQVQILYSP